MTDADTRACLALHRNPRLSNSHRLTLLKTLSSPADAFALSPAALVAAGLPDPLISALAPDKSPQLVQDLQRMEALGITLLGIHSEDYPSLLREIADPPALLYARGRLDLLNSPQLAMVGSRRCTRQGAENAHSFAAGLATLGFAVTSGLALGIDAESHRGALSVDGKTLGVLGTGIDVPYPRRNKSLYDQLARQGVLLSEFPLGTPPRPGNFPVRNRIVSGMSLGVLVVEGAPQSGSLVTARLALEQGREVFAIPGSIHSPASRGCHQLIRDGARLVETCGQIVEELGSWFPGVQRQTLPGIRPAGPEPDAAETALLAVMGYDPVTIDCLQRRSGEPVATLLGLLTALELKGLVESQGACYQRLCQLPVD